MKDWNKISNYGKIMKEVIEAQLNLYKKERNRIKKTKISQNIGYLVQVQSSLIFKNDFEERIENLEKIAGISKEGHNNETR